MIERMFRVGERKSAVATEVIAGLTTFMTMSYVIFVQPAVLSIAGMDFGAVLTATCISAAFGSILMGFLANLPIAQAPGMGQNFFFAFTVCGAAAAGGYGFTWQAALGTVFISGALFAVFTLGGMRDKVMKAMPMTLKYAIGAGIGLFIALIGMQWGGIVVASPGTMVKLGKLSGGPAPMVFAAVVITGILMTSGVRGAILIGIAVAAVWSLGAGFTQWHGFVGAPHSLSPTFLKLDLKGAIGTPHAGVAIFTFFILVMFDSIGTITAIAHEAGLAVQGQIPKAQQGLFSDAAATMAGALLGTSTVTSYIESSTGVAEGGRTGLAAVVTGVLFLLAVFLYPLAQMIGGGFESAPGVFLYPIIAPAMIIVGSVMVPLAGEIDWRSPAEAIPAFLTMVSMPFTFSITEGLAFGIISYSLFHTGLGGSQKTSPIIHLLAVCFLLRFAFLH